MKKTYAHKTDVPVSRSREHISHELKKWACDGLQWSEDLRAGRVSLVFRWPYGGHDYVARITMVLPTDAELALEFSKPPTEAQLVNKREQRWRALHRVLLLTIKAKLNAVDAGLMTCVEAFLPFLVDRQGHTVAEVVAPQIGQISAGGFMLTGPIR